MMFISIACDDCEDEVDLATIDACEYILPSFNSTKTFSNDLTTFELNFGPDTLESNANIIDLRTGMLNDTDKKVSFGCFTSDNEMIVSGENNFNSYYLWEEEEWYDGPILEELAENYLVDGEFDARAWASELLGSTYLNPKGYPLMITFGFLFQNVEDASGSASGLSLNFSPSQSGGLMYQAAVANTLTKGTLVDHMAQHEVNGVVYEDVILVEVEYICYITSINGNESDNPVYDLVYNYWFAKDIGLIETTDHDFKLEAD